MKKKSSFSKSLLDTLKKLTYEPLGPEALYMATPKKRNRKFIPVNFGLSSQELLFGTRALIKKSMFSQGELLFRAELLFGTRE